ncbi:hypothetical protein AB0I66_17030 [Streptomyces sp. NPDC050439]|uniref:hypothetical protein n=1 Tax=unclassified Streptomyces TaxID=2593676 RepID=UPI00342B9AA7
MPAAYSPIPELNLLKEFHDGPGKAGFSDGFEMYEYGRRDAGLGSGDAAGRPLR